MADHGIEKPEERVKKGKSATRTLLQKAFHESGQVIRVRLDCNVSYVTL